MQEGDLEDRHYIERCLSGDLEAFGPLVERYQRPLFCGIFNSVRNYDDAQELTQQVFLKIFQNLDSFDSQRRFFSWAYRIAMNESINFMKSKRPAEALHDAQEPSDTRPDPLDQLEMDQRSREVHKAVGRLESKYREPIVLCHFLQHSYEEASQTLDIPLKTLKSRLFTARSLLRELLEEPRP